MVAFAPRVVAWVRAHPRAWPWLVLALVFTVYAANGDFLPGHDTSPNVYLAINVIQRGELSFTPESTPGVFLWKLATPSGPRPVEIPFPDDTIDGHPFDELLHAGALQVTGPRYNVIESRIPGRYVSTFPVATGLFALPLFFLVALVTGDITALGGVPWHTAKVAASLFMAGSAVFVFVTALAFLRPRRALVVALGYAFGTSVFSLGSQALWTHGPTELCIAAGAWCWLLRPSLGGRALAGLAFAGAAACRPASALLLVVPGLWLLVTDRRALVPFVLGALPPMALLLAYNAHFFGSPLAFSELPASTAFAAHESGSSSVWQPSWQGAVGFFFSPSRGLLVFSPFLIFELWGIARVVGRGADRYRLFRPLAFATGALAAVPLAFFNWWSGWSYGYRLAMDLLPLLALFAIPVLDRILDGRARWPFAVLVGWSIFVQALGAWAYDLRWNALADGYDARGVDGARTHVATLDEARALAAQGAYVVPHATDVDQAAHRSRLWSLRDNEIGYYLTHVAASRASKHALMRALTDKSIASSR